MPMLSDAEYESMTREVEQLLRDGALQAAIESQARLVEKLMQAGPKAVQSQRTLAERLERTASQLVDSLRWARSYEAAVALQESLMEYLPGLEESLLLSAANLRIESGEAAEAGLAQLLEMAEREPDNYWYQVSVASAYLYLDRFEEAEQWLRRAAEMTGVRKIDRAMAYEYLFSLYRRQGKTDEALAAWREAGRLDSSLRAALLPGVCRMLVAQRKFPEARKHIALERVQARKLFFQGLVALAEDKPGEAAAAWHKLMSTYDLAAHAEGLEEFAETCLRMGNPSGTIAAIEQPEVSGQPSCQRSMLLGLAYAQRKVLERARQHLEIALRLGDLERPRLTLPAAERRVLPEEARDLFSNIYLDPTVRQNIEDYFVAKP